jgi:hypothetical protein
MNAATYFGTNYREATRKPGQAPRPGMKTLNAQGEEEAGQRVRFRCPECERKVVMRATLARADEADDDEGGGLRDVRCSACGEALSLEAPRGYRWATEAAAAFSRAYGRVQKVRESTIRHRHLAVAMTIR